MAMELLGPSCWGAVNSMHLPQDTFQDSEAWIDDGLDSQPVHEPLRMPSTEWIVKTGKGMLKVGVKLSVGQGFASRALHRLCTCCVHHAGAMPAQASKKIWRPQSVPLLSALLPPRL
jgi:hypothetical protein